MQIIKKIRAILGHQAQLAELNARISVLEGARRPAPISAYVPKTGEYFRVRFATIQDRSYIDVIWKCLGAQGGGILAKSVRGYAYGREPRVFVAGDMYFYPADELVDATLSAEKSGA